MDFVQTKTLKVLMFHTEEENLAFGALQHHPSLDDEAE
jgi:hypothetical protein